MKGRWGEGRPRDKAKDSYTVRYGLTHGQRQHLRHTKIEQLEKCKDDAARRLLLGKSQ